MDGEYSLYFHLPFCKRRCPYCHFYVRGDREKEKDALLKALLLHYSRLKSQFAHKRLLSIYFGGGTPTLFIEGINRILSHINPPRNIEITVEGNPEDITGEKLQQLRAAGVNRLSLGVQSLDDTLLSHLGRNHSSANAVEAIETAYAKGFENITIDLMYDIPHMTMGIWQDTLQQLEPLPVKHLSLYNLTFEPGTSFARRQAQLKPHVPREGTSVAMLKYGVDRLKQLGMQRYEISAFAKNNFQSCHNRGYWEGRTFWGLGPSACSYVEGVRFRNISNLHAYVKAVTHSLPLHDFKKGLSQEERWKEHLAIHLRLLEGVDLVHFEKRWGQLPRDTESTLQQLIKEKLLSKRGSRIRLSYKGALFYDTVATAII